MCIVANIAIEKFLNLLNQFKICFTSSFEVVELALNKCYILPEKQKKLEK